MILIVMKNTDNKFFTRNEKHVAIVKSPQNQG